MEQNQISDKIFNIEIDMIARDHLKTITTWARIIALIAFINAGLTLLGVIISPDVSGTYGLVAVMFLMLIYLGIVVTVNLFLLRFANNTSTALNAENQELFNMGTGYLGTYFKVLGIIMIVGLCLVALFLLFAGLGRAFR